jgi:2-hydroxychromene-2-carboxylate isomerase
MDEIEFHFDFSSPNAYLAHRVIPSVKQRVGAGFRYVPVLLGGVFKATNNRSPMEAFRDIPSKRAFMELETRRFLARHGITDFRPNPHFPVNTLAIMRGAVAAQHAGCFERYVEVVFRNMWSEPKKMDEPEVIRAVLGENGLDAKRLLDLAQSPGSSRNSSATPRPRSHAAPSARRPSSSATSSSSGRTSCATWRKSSSAAARDCPAVCPFQGLRRATAATRSRKRHA